MPIYEYQAINERGKTVRGIVDAESARVALEKLRKQSIYPSSVAEVEKKKGGRFTLPGKRGVSTGELAIATRQFSTLLGAGLPIDSTILALSEQTEDARLSQIFAQVRDRISEGETLAGALEEHQSAFPEIYVNLVRSGERSGTLDIVLSRLANFLEKQMAIQSKVRGALVYPAFMLFFGSAVLFFMMTYVIPRITKIFEESGKALPLMTIVLIKISSFLSDNMVLLPILAAGVVFGLYRFKKTPKGKRFFDRFILRLPVIGRLAKMVAISRFARTLSTILASGIPLLEALEVAESVVGNTVFAKAIGNVRENIREGTSLAPQRKRRIPPPCYENDSRRGTDRGA